MHRSAQHSQCRQNVQAAAAGHLEHFAGHTCYSADPKHDRCGCSQLTCRVSISKLYTLRLLLRSRPSSAVRPPGASTAAATSTTCLAVMSSQAKGSEAPGARLSHTQLAGASCVVLRKQYGRPFQQMSSGVGGAGIQVGTRKLSKDARAVAVLRGHHPICVQIISR